MNDDDRDEPRVICDVLPTREEQEAFIAANGFGNLIPDSDGAPIAQTHVPGPILGRRMYDGWTR